MPSVKGKLASKLVALRGDKTLYQFAKECKIARSILFRLENGERFPTREYLEKLAVAYKADITELKTLYFEDLYPEGSDDRELLFRWVLSVCQSDTQR